MGSVFTAMIHWRRYVLLLSLARLLQCSPVEREEDAEPPAAAAADRESWKVEIEVREGDLQVEIQAAYVADFTATQTTYGDSGVSLEFRDGRGRTHSRVSADRLTLDRDRAALGGEVVLRAGEGVEVKADTLVWERRKGLLAAPGEVQLKTSTGSERGRALETDFEVRSWTLEAVQGRWQGNSAEEAYNVEIQARRERGQREEGRMIVHYDSVAAECEGTLIRSLRARFDETAGFIHFSGEVNGRDSTRKFGAGELNYDLVKRRLRAGGQVELSAGEWDLHAAEVVEEGAAEEKRLRARGQPAAFVQGERRIEAAELDYAPRPEVLQARGQVVLREAGRILEAPYLVYNRLQERLEASGELRLQEAELEGVITGKKLVYDLAAQRAELHEDPRWRRRRSDGTWLEAGALEMEVDLRRRKLRGEGEFRVACAGLNLGAGRGFYDADREDLALASQVRLRQEDLENKYRSEIEADSMVAELPDGRIARIRIPQKVKGKIESETARISWIEGGAGAIFFQDERLQRVELEGGADVTHRKVDEEEVSRFKGRTMTLHFVAGALEQVWVSGEAEVRSHLPDKERGGQVSINAVKGEELDVSFAQGAIAEVRVVKSVEGKYYPPDDAEGP